MAAIRLANLVKTFPGRPPVAAVRDLSLHTSDGELIVLVGPSGCGKTTTLRMIAGLDSPTSGSIHIGGRDVTHLRPKRRRIAMVFQDYALYPHMTVRKNLTFPLRMQRPRLPRSVIDDRATRAAQLTGVANLLQRKPGEISGGECQRTALARAIAQQPDVLLLDEPLSNVDAPQRARLRAEIKTLQRQLQITTLYVTHDQEEAMALADRLVVMAQGQVQQVGAPIAVYEHPANRFVAGFLGSPPMNFINGRLENHHGRLQFTALTNFAIDLSSIDAKRLALLQSRMGEVVLGVRPQHVRVISEPCRAEATVSTLHAKTRFAETLGDHCDVHAVIDSGAVVIVRQFMAHSIPPASIRLAFDAPHLHFFEQGDFGRNLASAPIE
jgi:multiple sugar transport system ATP-binding protein